MQLSEPSEQEIRERAHQLWERAGQPEGREEEFWHAAEQELRNEDRSNTLGRRIRYDRAVPLLPQWAGFAQSCGRSWSCNCRERRKCLIERGYDEADDPFRKKESK